MHRGFLLGIAVALGLLAGPAAFGQSEQDARVDASASEARARVPEGECFSRQEQRLAVNQGFAIRLGMALRSVRAHDGDELLRAELCRHERKLVYVLTLLSRTGKVSRAVVDARSGDVIKDR
jgi:uncharacterized membrane protein YkoI